MSQRTTPTEAGDINRRTSEEKGRENSGTGTEFGQSIGRSENLDEGKEETMDNRNKTNRPDFEEESSRRPSGDSGFDSSQGRKGSMDVERDSDLNKSQSDRSGSRNIGSSSEGEH